MKVTTFIVGGMPVDTQVQVGNATGMILPGGFLTLGGVTLAEVQAAFPDHAVTIHAEHVAGFGGPTDDNAGGTVAIGEDNDD